MAGQKSFFLTGANAKIVVNGVTMAFATDISFTVQVTTVSPRVMGMYEVLEHQPTAIDVQGSFGVIRYAKGIEAAIGTSPIDTNPNGNGIGFWSKNRNNRSAILGLPFGDTAAEGRIGESFDPSRMHQSFHFDLEIRQKIVKTANGGTSTAGVDTSGNTARDIVQFGDALRNGSVRGSISSSEECSIIRLRNCKITGLNFKLAKKSPAMQAYNFKARYMDDDSFLAGTSGVGHDIA